MDNKTIFHVPTFEEFPNISVYKDQLLEILNAYLAQFYNDSKPITSTMINNYVKFQIIDPPVKKRYTHDQVAYLYLVCLLKKVFSLEEIKEFIIYQQSICDIETAYNYFCEEMIKVLNYTFMASEVSSTQEKIISESHELLRSIIISVVNKIYVEIRKENLFIKSNIKRKK